MFLDVCGRCSLPPKFLLCTTLTASVKRCAWGFGGCSRSKGASCYWKRALPSQRRLLAKVRILFQAHRVNRAGICLALTRTWCSAGLRHPATLGVHRGSQRPTWELVRNPASPTVAPDSKDRISLPSGDFCSHSGWRSTSVAPGTTAVWWTPVFSRERWPTPVIPAAWGG